MNKNRRLYLDIHVLQTVPPSCINRDDTGSPKTAIYGGVTRARVSSQSWKRAVRTMFKDRFKPEQLGMRTTRIASLIAEEIERMGGANPKAKANKMLKAAGIKTKSSNNNKEEMITGALFYISIPQVNALAQLACEEQGTKGLDELAKQALREKTAIDIALFGRMVAEEPSLNSDACAQVAHSISTHRVTNEYDYFTAIDDLASKDNAGAAHINAVEFNSSTLYRYATVAVHELEHLLKEYAVTAACEFARAFVYSMPTGKQNTFANRTLPDAVLITLREDQPVNLVGAFEKPVAADDHGYVEPSAKNLVAHAKRTYQSFAGEPYKSFVVGELLSELSEPQSMDQALRGLECELKQWIGGGEEQ